MMRKPGRRDTTWPRQRGEASTDLIAHQLQTAEGVTVDWAEGAGLPANPACILGHGVMRSNEKKNQFFKPLSFGGGLLYGNN